MERGYQTWRAVAAILYLPNPRTRIIIASAMTWTFNEFELSDDSSKLDRDFIFQQLRSTYWAADRSQATINHAIANSLCFGIYQHGAQVGFCRAVTDGATFTWICDVIIDPKFRGLGLAKWMMEKVVAHPSLQTCTQLLATRDAHTLYERFGFKAFDALKRHPLAPSQP